MDEDVRRSHDYLDMQLAGCANYGDTTGYGTIL